MSDYAFTYSVYQRGHIYEWISMANHSCGPNSSAVAGFPGVLRALRDIPEGEEVTIDYNKRKARFRCRCMACEARRARRFSLGMSSDGSAGDYIKRKFRSLGMSRSSVDTTGDEDGDDVVESGPGGSAGKTRN